MLESTVKKILNAAVYGAAKATPLDEAASLSKKLDNRVMIKREDLQSVFSFKLRGAFNKMQQLTDEQKKKGVICASAGNHAQGIAESGRILDVKTTIVMPKTTPAIKVKSVRDRGGKVILHGDAYDEAFEYSQILMKQEDLTFIHPFDDIDVIAGQGTVAREILQEVFDPIEAIFIPVGGGGLCAGMAAYIKYLRPEIKIIAVEYEESACLKAALDAGKRVILEKVGIFADGVAVAQIGKEPFSILKDHVDAVITINAAEICAAIKDIFDDTRSVAEPAGALGVAGLKKYVYEHNIRDRNLIAICSGANMNFDRLRYVAEQANIGEQTEVLLAVTIDEKAGSFKKFCSVVGTRTITEFNYRYDDPANAQIFVGVQVSGQEDGLAVISELVENDYQVEDLTQNPMATNHIRHMVGGRAGGVTDEKIYRFEFPERPKALFNFLKQLGFNWNISLFHYRNNGAASGRVLVGIQIPQNELKEFETLLSEIGYQYWNESNNPAYKLFLA
ncbi:MAG: threonine ammonia-lyase, biosynthetic [Saccharospirillaceae bacterium]|nr:threonine ammonia-lyase, biosynthetic [Pseudomonadales bacterium]NRB81716.1 threonine ammonia-lyase, biosynthetic [Saccharospirillaceae bacterium]